MGQLGPWLFPRAMALPMKTSMKTSMKKKKSIIAKGVQAKSQVLKGTKVKTSGGLKKDKRGKVVSKKMHAAGKKRYGGIKKWTECVNKARSALGLKGFVAINGKKPEGKALYAKAKALYAQA